MFRNKKIHKNYTVIIIPEKGASTKTLSLSNKLLNISLVALLVLLVCICFFTVKYSNLSKDILLLKEKNEYIESLERGNKEKQQKIDSYNNYENTIKNKLIELEKLEDDIKSKLNKSSLLKGADNKVNYTTAIAARNKDIDELINELDSTIISLNEVNNEVNNALIKESYTPTLMPCKGYITSYFGKRKDPFNNRTSDIHQGIDIASPNGTKIYAAASGKVSFSGYRSGYGYSIIINHQDGLQTLYGHTSKIYVSSGQAIKKGELIALVGSTGSSTGPHLHFELRQNQVPIDPLEFYKKRSGLNVF